MNVVAERSKSVWIDDVRLYQAPVLDRDGTADVVVVGAGIAGLSCAYELAREGRSVVVVDRGTLGGGMTCRTTAHLASAWDDLYSEFIKTRGLEDARQLYASQAAAIARIEEIQREEGIDCDFARVDGYLFLAPGDDPAILEREIVAAQDVGLAASWAERVPGMGFDTGVCLCFPQQGRVHPMKYLNGLIAALRRRRSRFFADTAVVSVEEERGDVVLTTEHGRKLRAQAAIVATNSPVNDRVAIHSKQAPYRTYVVAGPVQRGAVADALFWDTGDPYHYVRLQPGPEDTDLVIIGGEDHKSGEADDMEVRLGKLEAWARTFCPALGNITHRWSGQVLEPVDSVGYVGRNPGNRNVYMVTGDSGQGITTGAMAGLLLRDLILGCESPWAKVYDPERSVLSAPLEFIKENVTIAQSFTQFLTPGEIGSLDELQAGQGAVIRQGLKKVAAYRDEHGLVHARSAACTHLNCIVAWNAFEHCWDCPCHGSQFAIDGAVLNGPAVFPLAEAGGVDGNRPVEAEKQS